MQSKASHNTSILASSQAYENHQISMENYSGHYSRHDISIEAHTDIIFFFQKVKKLFFEQTSTGDIIEVYYKCKYTMSTVKIREICG